jgi:hypothetical protein
MKRLFISVVLSMLAMGSPGGLRAEVVRVVIEERADVLEGRAFGGVGAYEKLIGRVYFVFDPDNPMNAHIVDLAGAPRNADGLVEAWANFMVLQPKDPSGGARTALLEVSNRGGKAILSYFNGARGSRNPELEEHFGDGLLMRQGLTLIWVGWQHDVPDQDYIMKSHLPVAVGAEPLRGLVRSDWTVDQATSSLGLGHRAQIAYPVADPSHPDNVLTVRDGRMAPRQVISRDEWSFAREQDGRVVDDPTSVYMENGFEAGKIYEMVYVAEDPVVVGLGLAIVRDMMSYAKYGDDAVFHVDRGIAIGISQTGRFLRHFVYQGFNTDEQDRKVYDGIMAHTAGAGRGSFNHRFAQPSRDAHRYSAFFYPTDIFPFTSRTQTDTETGWTDGLFAHQLNDAHLPRIFYTNTGYEYWGRAASLIHTTVDGLGDIELYPNERVYHLASGQHFLGRFPPPANSHMPDSDAYRGNPLNFQYTIRALLVQMIDWVWDASNPPPSMYPRIATGTLVPLAEVEFPELRGVAFPAVTHDAYRADYGSRWSEGIVDVQPPALGPRFPVMVAQVDRFGNERGGVPTVEILAPLATYAPWNLRAGYPGGTDELTDFVGTYIPLARTEAERRSAGDPRPSIETLYRDKDDFLRAAREAAEALAERRLVLHEHVNAVVERAEAHWDWIMSRE